MIRGFMPLGVAQTVVTIPRNAPTGMIRGFMPLGVAQMTMTKSCLIQMRNDSWLYAVRRCSGAKKA